MTRVLDPKLYPCGRPAIPSVKAAILALLQDDPNGELALAILSAIMRATRHTKSAALLAGLERVNERYAAANERYRTASDRMRAALTPCPDATR